MGLLWIVLGFGIGGTILLIINEIVAKRRAAAAINEIPNFRTAIFSAFKTGHAIAIDTTRNQLAIRSKNGKIDRFDFKEVIGAEIVRNGETVIKTNRGSQITGAAVGGLLFGTGGFLLGGLSGSQTTREKIRKLSIKIYTRDLRQPVREIVAYEGRPVNPDFERSSLEALDNWYGRLKVILESRDVDPPQIMSEGGLTALRRDRG